MLYRAMTLTAIAALVAVGFIATAPATRADDAKDADVAEIHITGADTMQYNITAFTVKSGQTVKLTMKNIGKLPAAAMSHNCCILKKGVDLVQFALKGNQNPPSYFPADGEKDVIAHTKLCGPGESDTVTFKAPAPGVYDYVCTFPGHFAIMKGKMTVK